MSFESFLEKITTPASPEKVLVCEATFDGLHAVAVEKKGDKLIVGQKASSDLTNLDKAVEDVVKKIHQTGWKGQHAIMSSPAVCLSVLELNIPAKNKLLVQQVAETMQWELEPTYNQHKSLLVIGQLLQLAGHLNAEQVDAVMQQQNELINSKNSTVVYKRFGELAIEAGFLSKKQIDDSLERQRWFISEGEMLKCGWRPLEQQPMAGSNEYKWLVSGVNQDILRAWQAAFSKQEIMLEAMYPIASGGEQKGDGKPKSGQTIKNSKEILVELHSGMMSGSVIVGNEPMQLQTMPCNDSIQLANIAELVSALGQEDDTPIRVVNCLDYNQQQSQQLANDIKMVLDRPVEVAEPSAGKIKLPMRNSVKKFFRFADASYVEAVSVHEPLPSVMQRFSVRAILAGLFVIGIIGFTELCMLGGQLWYNTGITSISEDVGKIRAEKKRINKKIDEVAKLNKEITKKEVEKKNITTMISLLSKELPERNQMLSQLMLRLGESITDDIVVNNITEDTLLGFKFNAWALSDQTARAFIKKFQLAIHPMDFRIKNLVVKEQTGRLGLIGYSVTFSITQYSETEWNARSKRVRTRGRGY